jgi:hypothetical protein
MKKPVRLVSREELVGSQLERLPDTWRVMWIDLAADPVEVWAQISLLIDSERAASAER